ncbi:MAG: sigma-70 family RNA polymerase sigma factor [Anaerolineae bacterium]|nr:sigma-70 family RNA polymerase sigma factor [Anaerolineae bacterium]
MNKSDDITLAHKVADGDESALAAFYARYAEVLFVFIYQHLPDARPDAEEIWQDTLLAALRSLPGYRGDAALFTWLCGIARHKLNDYFRRHTHDTNVVFSDLPEGWPERLSASGPLPEEILANRTVRIQVVEALGVLPEEYRTALVARYADERPVDEVARLLGRTYKATESLLSRARATLRNALTPTKEKQ